MKFFVFLLLAACDPNTPCRSLEVDQDAQSLPAGGVYAWPISHRLTKNDFNEGPVAEQYCCAAQRERRGDACAEFDCTLPHNVGVTVKSLGAPYFYEYGFDSWQSCNITVREGRITAIWSRLGG